MIGDNWCLLDYQFYDLDYEFYKLTILKEFECRPSDIVEVVLDLQSVIDHAPTSWI